MEHKIIFAGPVGAGKTTAIGAISDIEVVSTESKATDSVSQRKETTTVAMDYGTLNVGDGQKVHLYGTPGQERFSFMWDIVTIGGLGLVVLIDNNREDPLADLEFYIQAFRPFIRKSSLVIGVTSMDKKARPGLYSYHTKLSELGIKAPVFEVDARERNDISVLLQALLAMLDPGVKR
ncbi:ATP/GTP-binding protein [Marinobacter sp. M216]|uniref:ATP/GTP-binding protein n=1 Tax=Marinobacter albus TaxID=3030833 RepID=A0ABT7HIQ4_9GAMM|nr:MULTISPECIES: ATP/GTP-binding protein [unclassified Marinobacter]MBW7472853.1 ATP/GTP-binding protein [Marinobacter sp. F4218]MDK9559405.1 ATP/GTP-binding protein [Marinobacter sp. M216]